MMDSYLLLQKKQELFSFPCTFFSSLFTGKRTRRSCWGFKIYFTNRHKLELKKRCLRDKMGLKNT